jgi:hypothetical protein
MNAQSKPIDTWLTRVSTAVAVTASIVGGWWAYSRFIAEEEMIAPPSRFGTAGSAWRFPQNGD